MIKSLTKRIITQIDSRFDTSLHPKISSIVESYRNSSLLNAIRRNTQLMLVKSQYKFQIGNKYHLKLHLGCGSNRLEGYTNIDWRKTVATDLVCDIRKLPYPNSSVDLIEVYHVVEHLPRLHLPPTLLNWNRVLTPGGTLIIECPDFDESVNKYLQGEQKQLDAIFGHQRFEGDYHLFGYNFERLKLLLEEAGFVNIRERPAADYHARNWPCFRVECMKIDLSSSLSAHTHEELKTEFTGERVIEGLTPRRIWLDHTARYLFAGLYARDSVVLDAACGSGFGARILKDEGAKFIHAVDIAPETVEFANRHYASDQISFETGDVLNLDFPASFFDLICCFETIEHIQEVDKALSELQRVLKPKGHLIISSPNRPLTSPGRSQQDKPDNIFHGNEYSLGEILGLVSRYFEIQEVNGQRGINRFLLLPVIGKLIRHCRPHFYRPDNGSFTVTKRNFINTYRFILLS